MTTTISYDFAPNTEVFVITDDYTISEGSILYVKALKYFERTLFSEEIKDVTQYVVGLNDGRSIVTDNPSVIHDTFESAKAYLNAIL
jgi:hypothetical protein